MTPALVLGAALLAQQAAAPAAPGNPFDPKGYIDQTVHEETQEAERVSERAIFRINGQRFQKFASSDGAVYLPSTGDTPELLEEFALCPQHLKLMNEVLPVREHLKLDGDLKKDEAKIVALIRKCKEGRVKGPTIVVDQPDGAQVEVKAKEKGNGRSVRSPEASKPTSEPQKEGETK